jgi:hypothetical protein
MTEPYKHFKNSWEKSLSRPPKIIDKYAPSFLTNYPHFLRHITRYDANEFVDNVMNANQNTAENLVESVISGDLIVLKGAHTGNEIKGLRRRIMEWRSSQPQAENERIEEGCQDFHKINETEREGKNSYKTKDHPHIFFRWNSDPIGIFSKIDKYWSAVKVLSGLPPNSFKNSTPKDGIIDKLTIFQYPMGFGRITKHRDPPQNQKLLLNLPMSEMGVDYARGDSGFYLVDGKSGNNFYVENLTELGDYVLACPSMHHGAQPPMPIDQISLNHLNWETELGRWLLAAISIPSHHVEERNSTIAIND